MVENRRIQFKEDKVKQNKRDFQQNKETFKSRDSNREIQGGFPTNSKNFNQFVIHENLEGFWCTGSLMLTFVKNFFQFMQM